MKFLFLVSASCLVAGSVSSTELLVGQGETAEIRVADGESVVQDARLVTADGGRVVKSGTGTWTIPGNVRQTFLPIALDAKSGRVSLPAASGAVPTNPVPPVVSEMAAMWLDASVPASLARRVDGEACYVDTWYDVRETTPATPTRLYAQANLGSTITSGSGTWTYTAAAPELKEKDGRPMIWFGGHASARSMSWFTPNGLLSCKRHEAKVRHVFILRGAWDYWGTIVGAIPSLTSTSLDWTQSHPLLAPSQYGTAGTYGTYSTTESTRWTRNARLYENGVRVDPQTTYPCKGLALLDFSTQNEPFTANTFFNDRNFIGADCPIWGGDRGGGEYIAEAIVFTNVLTETQRLQVQGYLMQKWLGTPAEQSVDLKLAPTAQVEFGSDRLSGASIAGNGRLVCTAAGEVACSSRDRVLPDASLVLGDGAVTLTKTLQLAVDGGDAIDATPTEDGPRVVRTATAPGTFVKTGDAPVSVGEISADVQTFDVQTGRVSVRTKARDVLSARDPVPVALANAGFEDGWTESQKTSGTRWVHGGDALSGWTVEAAFAASDGYAYYAPSGKCGPGTAWGISAYPSEGDCFALIRSGLRLLTPVTIPADGTYEVAFDWSGRPGYLGGQLDVWLEGTEGASKVAFGHLVVIQSDVFRTCRFRAPVSAGSYRLVFSSRTVEDCPVLLDDVRLTQVFPVEDGTVPVPGGDFEGADFASFASMQTFSPGGRCDGWVLGENAGPVTFLANVAHARVDTGTFYNDSRRSVTGDGFVQLAFTNACSASRTFRPAKGVWLLMAALDHFGENRATLAATVTKGGVIHNLGACKPVSHLMEDVVWPQAFEVDGTEEVTLTLACETAGVSGAGLIVDDVRLLKASRSTAELVRNGGFEEWYDRAASDPKQGWCMVKGSYANSEAYMFDYANGKPYWGYAEYEGRYRLKLCGDAYTHQTVTFPQAGHYRLSLHMSHRCQPDHPDWGDFGHNPVRVWLTRGGATTNELALLTDFTTNYVQHVVDFAVPEAGDWDFALGGTRVGDYSSLIDGISIRAIDVVETARPFAASTDIRVAAGAKLSLDFAGTNRVQSLRLGGRGVTGVVNAETHPDFIQGFGSLYVLPSGSCLILR